MNAKEVDVEKIMKEIKRQAIGETRELDSNETLVKQENINSDNCDIPDMEIVIKSLEMQNEMRCYDYINSNYRLQFYRDLGNKNKLIKRIIRKLVRFCVHPIVNEQSEFNYNLLQLLMIQNEKINVLNEELDLIKKKNNQFQNSYKK